MTKKKYNRSSGIGGQAVLEGVMMKNKDDYAVAIRKPNGEIEVEVDVFRGSLPDNKIVKLPFIRGVFNFVDSLRLGIKILNYSASFYEDEGEETKLDKALDSAAGGKGEGILMGITTVVSILLAVGIFILCSGISMISFSSCNVNSGRLSDGLHRHYADCMDCLPLQDRQ